MMEADEIARSQAEIDGRWVASRPLPASFWERLRDAWAVLLGRAEAVKFWRQ